MGQIARRADILSISNADPCVIATTDEHGYATGDFVRLTNLNGAIPTPHGMDELNNNRYRIVVTGLDEFSLQDPITHLPINSTNFPPYTTGGYCNLIERNYIYYDDGDNNG